MLWVMPLLGLFKGGLLIATSPGLLVKNSHQMRQQFLPHLPLSCTYGLLIASRIRPQTSLYDVEHSGNRPVDLTVTHGSMLWWSWLADTDVA